MYRIAARGGRPTLSLIRPISLARFSTTAEEGYHSLDDQVFYEPVNKVEFTGEKFTVFDGDASKERKFVPFELKELGFKYTLIAGGMWTTNYMYTLSPFLDLAGTGAMLSCLWQMYGYMGSAVKKIELHRDGKQVTLTPRIGSAQTIKIKDIRKRKDEKSLVETYEESYLFPISVNGKDMYLHGQGQECIK